MSTPYDDALASRMFGSTTPTGPAPAPAPTNPAQAAEADMAAKLYGAPASNAQPSAQPDAETQATDPQAAENAQAAGIYGRFVDPETGNEISPEEVVARGVPEAVRKARAERDPDGASKMFADGDTAPVRKAFADLITNDTPVPEALKQAVVGEYTRIASDLGLQPDETVAVVKAAQATFAEGQTVTPEQVEKWNFTNANLAKSYGSREAAVVAEAKAMLRADPRLFNLVMQTGFIGHPEFNRHMLQAADRRLRGRK